MSAFGGALADLTGPFLLSLIGTHAHRGWHMRPTCLDQALGGTPASTSCQTSQRDAHSSAAAAILVASVLTDVSSSAQETSDRCW